MNNKNQANDKNLTAWFSKLDDWLADVRDNLQLGLGTLVERSVKLSLDKARLYASDEIEEFFPEKPVNVTVSFGARDMGKWFFLFPQNLTAVLSDLAMMGEGDAKFDEMLHPGTLAEIWGQVVGTLDAEIKMLYGDELSIEMPEASLDPSPAYSILEKAPVVRWNIDVENAGEGFVLMVVDPSFEKLFGTMDAEPQAELETSEIPEKEKRKTDFAKEKKTVRETVSPEKTTVRAAEFEDLAEPAAAGKMEGEPRNIEILMDVSLPISIELGRTHMLIRDVLDLAPGSIIELDKLSGEPVDLYVNDRRFAKGEVVVIEENFGVRITELIKVEDRIKALK